MGLYIFFVICAFLDPHICYGKLKGSIGIREYRYPFICVNGTSIVYIRADINLLNTDLLPEICKTAWHLARETPRCCFRVTTPEQDHFSIFGSIFNNIACRKHGTLNTLAPYMFRTPVPAFPGVRVTNLLRETAHLVKERSGMPVRGMYCHTFTMTVALDQYTVRSVLLVNPSDLCCKDIGCLIPGDPYVFTFTPVLRISFAIRVPVNPFHGELDPVWGINTLFVCQRKWTGK